MRRWLLVLIPLVVIAIGVSVRLKLRHPAPPPPPQRVGAYAPPTGVIHPTVESVAATGTVIAGPGKGLGSAPAAPPPNYLRPSPGPRGGRAAVHFVPTEATAPPPPPPGPPPFPVISAAGAAVEQTTMGSKPPAYLVVSFDGLGGPAPKGARFGGALDLSLAVGPTQLVQIINSRLQVFDKHGHSLYGPVPTNTIWQGFGGRCQTNNMGDAVVRYDQLANRWLVVMPIFRRPQGQPNGPYGMCYAVSTTSNALGTYNRYEFQRPHFPDYPRPAIWPDGYYVPTSSGDGVIQKQDCIADRAAMLAGRPASEQCVVIDGVSFLNNADVDGHRPPPPGAPNIMMAAGGTQLKNVFSSNLIYAFKVHVDWTDFHNTTVSPAIAIPVAPYHFLCNGQLSNCVAQEGSSAFLDSQGDKLMQRLVYRNLGSYQALVATHSIDTAAHSGGVRWYEFRLNPQGDPVLYQQGTYAPDDNARFMGSADMDKFGDIGIGYTFSGADAYPGQRFAARMAADPKGQLTLKEAVLANGEAAQNHNRWEDYATMAMDPSDDCTFWYVGDYIKKGETVTTTKIGAFRLPNCN